MAALHRSVAENRKARHDYHIDEIIEAGIALSGTEVKSLRQGRVNIRDSHAIIDHGECYLVNCHIAPYDHGNRWNHDPYRTRKLLLHHREIAGLLGQVKQKGYTLVPLRIYFNERGRAKVELALARGKRLYDKRESVAARDAQRRIERVLKDRQR